MVARMKRRFRELLAKLWPTPDLVGTPQRGEPLARGDQWGRWEGYDYHSERDDRVTYDLIAAVQDVPPPENALTLNDTGTWRIRKYDGRADVLILHRRWSEQKKS